MAKNFDGTTRGRVTPKTPHHKQTTKFMETRSHKGKNSKEGFKFPGSSSESFSAGQNAVSKYPVKY